VTVTGVLGILFAIVGLLGAAQMVFFPRLWETHKTVMDTSATSQDLPGSRVFGDPKNDGRPSGEGLMGVARQAFDLPAWFKPLSPISGVVELGVAGFYLFASIQLMSMTHRGLGLFRWALGISTLFHLLRGAAAISSLSILGLALVGGSLFWIVVNTVLFLTVQFGDKRAFLGD
jgi:hypothetical protein